MSAFEVRIVRVRTLERIEGADAIELAVVGDYRSVVRKNTIHKGDLVAYIPEAAVVPDWLLDKMGLTGKLSGPDKNRVKAIKLRGALSQGLILELTENNDRWHLTMKDATGNDYSARVKEGENVASLLGIVKYEPVIPASMAGEVVNVGTEYTVAYDIENIKKYPDVLKEGEEVVITEKIHGTFCGVVLVPALDADPDKMWEGGRVAVFSKGLGAQGLCFRPCDANENNVYVRAMNANGMFNKLVETSGRSKEPLLILGEVFGNVQDLTYGTNLGFRIFDVVSGYRNREQVYLGWHHVERIAQELGIETVPVLYIGPYNKEKALKLTSGKEEVSGNHAHFREGIVIKPYYTRVDPELGRVILKSVSQEYLLRNNPNATEYQ